MPRIRTIKPDAFLSESLSSVPRGTRWTFAGLWTYADDKGRARDDARLIKAALYPLDDDTTLDDVSHDLDLLAGMGGICRYVVAGRRYLHMPKWEHQKINRPTPAKSPPCPVHEDGTSGHVLDTDDSLSDHGALSEPSGGEKEGKGREKEGSSAAADGEFDTFWAEYPKKRDKGHAVKAYRTARKKAGADAILSGLRAHLPEWSRNDPKFIPLAATWLNGERWADEIESNVRQLRTDDQGRPILPPLPSKSPWGPA